MWPGIRSELVARTRWNKEELISCLVQLMYSNLVLPAGRRGNNSDVVVESYNLAIRGTQREYSAKPLKHSIVKRILVFKR